MYFPAQFCHLITALDFTAHNHNSTIQSSCPHTLTLPCHEEQKQSTRNSFIAVAATRVHTFYQYLDKEKPTTAATTVIASALPSLFGEGHKEEISHSGFVDHSNIPHHIEDMLHLKNIISPLPVPFPLNK